MTRIHALIRLAVGTFEERLAEKEKQMEWTAMFKEQIVHGMAFTDYP
jgi:hypothetical protein